LRLFDALIGAVKRLPEDRLRAKHTNVVGADRHPPDALGLAARRQIGPLDAVRVSDGDVERPAAIPVVDGGQASQVGIVAGAVRNSRSRKWLSEYRCKNAGPPPDFRIPGRFLRLRPTKR
jgi:hypothetical protein